MSAAALPARILIRADAGPELGGGHIMRCLALAASLKTHGASIAFACAPGSGDLVPALSRSGFAVMTARSAADFDLPPAWNGRADAILVDLYASTQADESRMRLIAPVIAVLEDLPDRPHDCDLLGDQGFDRQPSDYADRVPPGTTLLLGADMAPLRPDFARLRTASLARRQASPGLARLMVSMGMTDVGGISAQIVSLARASLPGITTAWPTASWPPIWRSVPAAAAPWSAAFSVFQALSSCWRKTSGRRPGPWPQPVQP